MREIKFKIFPSKKMLNLNGDNLIGRKSENITTRLKFIVDENLVQYYNYIVLTSPSEVNYLIELVDFHYDVKQWITNEVGAWQIEYLSTSQANLTSASEIDESQAILISNTLVLTVEDCNASGELYLEPGEQEQDLEDRITIRLESSIDEVAAVVDTIEEQILGIIETEGDITGKLSDALLDLVDVKSSLNTISGKVDGVDTKLTPIANNITSIKNTVEAIPTNDYTSDFSGIVDELGAISNKIDNIIIDFTPVLNKLNTIDGKIDAIPTTDNTNNITSIKATVEAIPTNDYTSKLNSIENKIDLIPTTDNSEDIASIKNTVESIPTNDYTSDLASIEGKIDNIPTNDYTSDLASIEGKIDNIPTNDYTSALTSISNKIDAIPTTDNTNNITSIKNTVESIPTTDYSTALDTIEGKIDNIPTTDNTSNIASIKNTVEAIPTNDYTTKLNGIENKIDLIPTNDYTSDLASIDGKIDNIPTNDYSNDLASIEGKVDLIPTTDYTNTLTSLSNKVDAIPTTDNTSNIASIKNTVEAIPTTDYSSDLSTIDGKCDDILTAIQNIGPGATGTAVASDVLSGKTFSNSQGVGINGAMTNNGAVNGSISAKAQSISIAEGYHNGNGSVAIASAEQDKIVAGNIKNGVTILGVEGTYQGQSATGDATTADVLSGKTFSNANGTGLNGSMTNVGAQTIQITGKAQQVTITKGYHDGNGRAMIDTTSMSNIIPGNIKDGVQILGVTGNYTGGASFKFKNLTGLFMAGTSGHSNLEIFDAIISSCDSPTDTSLDDFCSNMNTANASDSQLNNYKFSTILQTVPFSSMTSFMNAFCDQGLDIGYLQATIDLSSALVTSNMFQNFGVDKKTYPNPTPSQSYLELDFNDTGDNVYDARYMFSNANIKSVKNINCFYRTPEQSWMVSDPHYFGGVGSLNSDYCYIEELTFGDKPLFDAPWNDSDSGATLYDMTLDLSACSNFTANSIQQTLNSLVAKTQSNVVNIKLAHTLYVGLSQDLIDSVTAKGYTLVDANPT